MKHVVMGTAGHVDHGKTSLIKALTGIDCDRLAEEKEREITIDIGFAYMPAGDGRMIGIVDVPGHERFIRNMLAGVSGIDFVLMVIAADDGVMPQTLEHLEICNILKVQNGIIALTKTDLVEDDWVELVSEDVRKAMRGSFLEGAPIFPVSSSTGRGTAELAEAIRATAETIRVRNEWGPVRMSIDRAFVMKGAGTVVTGTLVSGTVKLNQELVILPSGREVRIRQIQQHGDKLDEAGAGRRVAVNPVGVEVHEIHRGDVLAAPGYLATARMIDVKLRAVSRLTRPIKNRSRVRFYIGTQELFGRINLLDAEELVAGGECYARVRLESPAVCANRDLFILRRFSPLETIGGGVILDAKPGVKRRSKNTLCEELKRKEQGTIDEVVAQTAADSGMTPVAARELAVKMNADPEEVSRVIDKLLEEGILATVQDTDKVVSRAVIEDFKAQVLARLKEYFGQFAKRPWVSGRELKTKYFGKVDNKAYESVIEEMKAEGALLESVSGRGIRPAEGAEKIVAEEEKLRGSIEKIYLDKKFNAPDSQEVSGALKSELLDIMDVYHVLVEAGVLIKLGPHAYIHREAVAEAIEKVVAFIREKGGITVGDVRDMLGTSRKFSVPLMEHLDSLKVTMRRGDARVLYPAQE